MYKAFFASLLLHSFLLLLLNDPVLYSKAASKRNVNTPLFVHLQHQETKVPVSTPEVEVVSDDSAVTTHDAEKTEIPNNSKLVEYIDSKKLDVHPVPKNAVMLTPPLPGVDDVPGYIVIYLYIDENGIVTKIDIEESTVSEAFQKSVISEFFKTNFNPGELNSKAVPSKMKIKIDALVD